MSKVILPPGVNAGLLEQGIVRVARDVPNLFAAESVRAQEAPDYLGLVDHNLSLGKKKYSKKLENETERRDANLKVLRELRISAAVLYEGRDAAGKSGCTKVIVSGVPFDNYAVVHVMAPNDEERAQPPLLRFFERDRMPAYGQLRVFDRSWYGEVLVVAVDKLASKDRVEMAYQQIRGMEWLLNSSDVALAKIWCDITKRTQKERFDDRIKEGNGKYQESDAKARKQWGQYTPWINKMFFLTGTTAAPWNIIPSDCKRWARIASLQIFNEAMEAKIAEVKKRSKKR